MNKKNNECLDCGKKISKNSKRCKSCANKGKRSSSWKGGKPKCIDCGKQLSNYGYKRCHKCNSTGKLHNMFMKRGVNSPRYVHGGKARCIDCGKEKSYGKPRCHSCAAKEIWRRSEYRNKKDMLGENNPMYGKKHSEDTRIKISIKAGGNGVLDRRYKYGSGFTKTKKQKIRQRDNYICQNCSMTEIEHLVLYSVLLICHHIDYCKTNNRESNLITLCSQCHARTNFKRKYWESYLSGKIKDGIKIF